MRRALRVSASPEVYEFPLDLDIQSRSRSDLLALRIVGNGRVEPYTVVRSADFDAVAVIPNPPGRIDSNSKSSVYTLDLGSQLPFEQVELNIADRVYSRVVRMETSADHKTWSFSGTGYISRTFTENSNSFSLITQQARYVRLSLVNNDNIPLQCNGIRFLMPRRTLQFVAHGPGPFWLYYGAPGIRPALYDGTEVRAYRDRGVVQQAQVGAPERNPAFSVNPLREGDLAYEQKIRDVVRTVKWVGIGSIVLFALLYLGYLSLEGKPRRHRRVRRRRKHVTESASGDVLETQGVRSDSRSRRSDQSLIR